MNKPKTICRCGKLIATKKFLKSKINNELICPSCYSKENYKRNRSCDLPIIKTRDKLIVNNKISNKNRLKLKYEPLLSREEIAIVKNKYKFDKFIAGTNKCKEISRIKKELIKTSNKKKNQILKDIEVELSAKKQNENFLNGLIKK